MKNPILEAALTEARSQNQPLYWLHERTLSRDPTLNKFIADALVDWHYEVVRRAKESEGLSNPRQLPPLTQKAAQ